jgi:hypothetical protein
MVLVGRTARPPVSFLFPKFSGFPFFFVPRFSRLFLLNSYFRFLSTASFRACARLSSLATYHFFPFASALLNSSFLILIFFPRSSQVTRHMSLVTHPSPLVTCHTSHVTLPFITRHMSHCLNHFFPFPSVSFRAFASATSIAAYSTGTSA